MRLAGNGIGDEGLVALAAVLPQMASLATLELRCTSPMNGGVGRVFVALAIILRLRRFAWVGAALMRGAVWAHAVVCGGDPGAEACDRCAPAGNDIEAEGAIALAAVLPQMASLATLRLGGTSPMDGGVGRVFVALAIILCLRRFAWVGAALMRGAVWAHAVVCGGDPGAEACDGCAARRERHRSRGRYCVGGGAAADGEPRDA